MSRQSGSEPGHRPDASRRQLVEIAIDCFALHGFQGTSIDRIARSAGVTKGALYYHFKDKEDLLLEAVKDRIGEFEVQVRDAVAASDDTHERLKRVIDACFVTATASNHRRFIITLMVEALDTNPRLSEQFRKVLRRMRGFLADVVADGQRRGVMRADVPPSRRGCAHRRDDHGCGDSTLPRSGRGRSSPGARRASAAAGRLAGARCGARGPSLKEVRSMVNFQAHRRAGAAA